jgi:hypothetical protein
MFNTEPSSGGSDVLQDAMFIHVVCEILSHVLNVSDIEAEYKL